MDLKTDLRRLSTQLGADLFGVASANAFTDAPHGHSPMEILPNAKSIIVLAIKMLDAQADIVPTDGEYFEVSSRQGMFKGHNTFISYELDRVGYALGRALEKKGFKAYHQMASTGGTDQRYLMGLLSLKHLAVQAGLGVFGHNSLLITPRFGPRVRLAAIITDAEVQPDAPINANFCERCESPCVSLCPVKALQRPVDDRPYEINKYACSQYLNTRPACSVCLKVCPVGNQRVR